MCLIKKRRLHFDMKIVLLLLSILLTAEVSIASNDSDSVTAKDVIKYEWGGVKSYASSPLKWSIGEYAIFGGTVAVATTSVYLFDDKINTFMAENHTPFLDKLSTVLTPMGSIYPILTFAGFAVCGAVKKDNYTFETSIIVAESVILTGTFVQIVKSIAGRSRPSSDTFNSCSLWWNGPFKGNSFFSGHTVCAFSMASSIAYRYRDKPWVMYTSYGVASMSGLQRIYQNRHWTSDVIVGAVVGTASGLFLARMHEKKPLNIYPVVMPQMTGLSVVIPLGDE